MPMPLIYTPDSPNQDTHISDAFREAIFEWHTENDHKPRLLWPDTMVEAEDAEFTVVSTLHKSLDPKYPI